MRTVFGLLLAVSVISAASAQDRYVYGHYTKSGKYVPGHYVRPRNNSGTTNTVPLRFVPQHATKSGKIVPGHYQGPKKTKEQIASEAISQGRHREMKNYPGHYAPDGHWVKPHSRWVWVKN